MENKLVGALLWTNYVMTQKKNDLRHIVGISLLQFLVAYWLIFIGHYDPAAQVQLFIWRISGEN